MASLRSVFPQFYPPDGDTVETAMRTGLVAPDTNVLLSLYRYQSDARGVLLQALERLGDRLWIPHQVGLEFHRRRLGVIAEQGGYFRATRENLDSALKAYLEKFGAFTGRVALAEDRAGELEKAIRDAHQMIIGAIGDTEDDGNFTFEARATDEVLARLEAISTDRVGSPMDQRANSLFGCVFSEEE